MSLIFCGDLTLPFGINIDIEDIKPLFANHEASEVHSGSRQYDGCRMGKARLSLEADRIRF